MVHPTDQVLQALTLGTLTTAESLRIQRHIFKCPDCLKRLIEVELLLALVDAHSPALHRVRPEPNKPLFMRHDTADGLIYSQVKQVGRRWVARHWGDQLNGQRECVTMREANEHAMAAFAQMFPEHRCTDRCGVDPPAPE